MLAHKHLILKGEIDTPRDAEQVAASLTELVWVVGMRVLRPASALYCTEEGNVGYTGDVLLTTSHMLWHDWTQVNGRSILQFDLYSCAPFDPPSVIDYLQKNHGLFDAQFILFDREYDIVEQYRWVQKRSSIPPTF